MWIYKSPVGEFKVIKDHSAFNLYLGDNCLGSYESAIGAADDVYLQHTGYTPWDSLEGVQDAPTDIYEWQVLPDPQQ